MLADRDERFLRKSFALYLAPEVVDSMVASGKMPALGGEIRNVTMFFSDLSGFSSIAETMTPGELVTLMNEYLSAMTDIIESHGGYVDKYIGDSIVAMFGAPADDPAHATNAVRAALKCHDKLAELNAGHPAFAGHGLSHRIGLNSGEAVVGNIGSRRRFNYTVMSDTVNVASRLEGANKYYGTAIMASETTKAQTGAAFAWRETRRDQGARAWRGHQGVRTAGGQGRRERRPGQGGGRLCGRPRSLARPGVRWGGRRVRPDGETPIRRRRSSPGAQLRLRPIPRRRTGQRSIRWKGSSAQAAAPMPSR